MVNLVQFFALNGFPCPAMRNPSDHYLRTVNKDFDTVSSILVQYEKQLLDLYGIDN